MPVGKTYFSGVQGDYTNYADSSDVASWNMSRTFGDSGINSYPTLREEAISAELQDYIKTAYPEWSSNILNKQRLKSITELPFSRYGIAGSEEQRAHDYYDSGFSDYIFPDAHNKRSPEGPIDYSIQDFAKMSPEQQTFILEGLWQAGGVDNYTADMYKDQYGTDFSGSLEDYQNWRQVVTDYYNEEYSGRHWLDKGGDTGIPYKRSGSVGYHPLYGQTGTDITHYPQIEWVDGKPVYKEISKR